MTLLRLLLVLNIFQQRSICHHQLCNKWQFTTYVSIKNVYLNSKGNDKGLALKLILISNSIKFFFVFSGIYMNGFFSPFIPGFRFCHLTWYVSTDILNRTLSQNTRIIRIAISTVIHYYCSNWFSRKSSTNNWWSCN